MRSVLTLHPESACDAVAGIEAQVRRPSPGVLELRYVVTGEIDALCLPPPAGRERADGLWRTTCLEAFIRGAEGERYCELNFAPSCQWAAYTFGGYRAGMARADEADLQMFAVDSTPEQLLLRVRADLSKIVGLDPLGPWRLCLSAVIAEKGGRVSYWALRHPPGKADFHHAHGFALELAPDEGAPGGA